MKTRVSDDVRGPGPCGVRGRRAGLAPFSPSPRLAASACAALVVFVAFPFFAVPGARAQEMVYRAEISAADRVNSRGAPLRTLREFLRQDRYNVHSGRNLDPGDTVDPFFGNPRARELIDSARLATTQGLEGDVASGRVRLLEVGVSRAGNRLEIQVQAAPGGAAAGGGGGGGGAPAPAPAPAPAGGAGAPEGALVYRAEISAADRVNSRGDPLSTLREFLRQDRFNVHGGRHQDPGDTLDPVFGTPEARAFIEGARIVAPDGLEAAVRAGRAGLLEVAVSQAGNRLEIHVFPAGDGGGAMAGGGGLPDAGGIEGDARGMGQDAGAALPETAETPESPEGYLAVYATTLGHGDFVDSNGEALSRLRDVLLRDRMRVNLLSEGDPGDERDAYFLSARQARQFFGRAEIFVDPGLLPELRARQPTRVAVHAAHDHLVYLSGPDPAREVQVVALEEILKERDFEAAAMAAARAPGAEAALLELAELSELAYGRAHEKTATYRVTLAHLLLEQGRAEEAGDLLPGIERDFRAAAQQGVDAASIYPVMGFLARAKASLGDAEGAAALLSELLDEPGSRRWKLGEEERARLEELRTAIAGQADPATIFREALGRHRELEADPSAGAWERLEALGVAVSQHPDREGGEYEALFALLGERVSAAGRPAGEREGRIFDEAALVLVLHHFDRGEFEAARRWCETALESSAETSAEPIAGSGVPGDEVAKTPVYLRYFHAISVAAMGEPEEAERVAGEHFAWAKALYAPGAEELYNLGGLFLEFLSDRGDAEAIEEAAADLALASVEAEQYVGTMLWHGLIAESCFAAGDVERSDLWFGRLVAALEASDAMRPGLPEAYSGWGHLHEGAGRYGRAEAIWTEGAARAEADPALFEGFLNLQQDLSLVRKHYRDEEGAVAILERARDLSAEGLGTESKAYATSCNNLVLVLHNLGRRDEALRMSDESLRVAASHPDREWGEAQTLTFRNNRAILMMGTDPAAAAEVYESVLSAAEGAGLDGSEEFTFYLMNHGAALKETGDWEGSEAAYARALELMRGFARPYGRNLSVVLDQLAKFALARGDAEAAAELARESVATMEAFFESASAFATESERLALGGLHRQGSAIHILVAAGAVEEACQISLRIKGMVLDRSIREARAIRSAAEDAESRRLFEELRARQRQLSRVAQELERRGAADPSLPALSSLRQEARALEAELLQRADAGEQGAAGLAEVRRRLGEEGVFVEFVLAADERGDDYLGAFEITREDLRWVRLETAERAQAAVAEFRAAIDALMAAPDDAQWAVQSARLEAASTELHAMLWAPFERGLAGRRRVVLSPDGPLHFVPFAVLLDAEGRFAGEGRVIEYVVSARDFCREDPGGARSLDAAVVVGGPDYVAPLAGSDAALAGVDAAGDPVAAERAGERQRALSGIARSGGVALEPLPGAEKEAGLVAGTLEAAGVEVTLLTAAEASERAVVDAAAPGILHVATHGIFFDLGFDSLVSGEFRLEVDPMLRGALALAGAENALNLWEEGSFPDPDDDGWLFAVEAAQLDLRGTALVTLSACDTGIGSIASGEGVVGLRRSFLAAGAGAVLSTLWPIADDSTVALMNEFYEEVGAGRPVAEAFSEAQGRALERFRAEGERASAILLFGAFVLNTSGG